MSTTVEVGVDKGVMQLSAGMDDFEHFFTAMIDRAMQSAYRVNRDTGRAADDAVEALARAHARWSHLQTDPHREAWVLRVAINVAIDQARRDGHHRRAVPATHRVQSFEPGVDDQLWVAEALAKLPRRQREAVTLRYLADLSEKDAAAVMAISPGTVKVHVHRGLKALAIVIAPEEPTNAT